MNFTGIPVGLTVTFDSSSDHNDSDKISYPRCTYFDCADVEPPSFDIEQYVDCVNNFNCISPYLNCEGETRVPISMK